jgi:YidC/Oxa1 family membrane protein insertase
LVRATDKEAVFRVENEAVALERRFKLLGNHHLGMEVVVENKTDKEQSAGLSLYVYGVQDPAKKGGGFWDIASSSIASMLCYVEGHRNPERTSIESLVNEPHTNDDRVRWVAADDKYFLVAAVLPPERDKVRCERRALDPLTGEAFVVLPKRAIEARKSTSYKFEVFAGPKYTNELEVVNPGASAHLDKAVDVNFAMLAMPLLGLLKIFQGWVGNWGLAIIMLTLFVKLVTFWPTHKAMMSGKKMQRLAPKMQELRKQYEKDRQRLGVETMNLYKREGVSPLGGCLPTLITMPIWIALFSTLNYAVELHRAPFLGYIHDLSARDPYFITPLLMGGIMFLQMRMSPAGADPQQQKIMAVMMPIMFTSFSLFLPAGLAIYTLTNSLFAILQQLWINRLDKRLHGPMPVTGAPAPAPASGGKPASESREQAGRAGGKGGKSKRK